MGYIQRRTNLTLGSIGSTIVLQVEGEKFYTISSGFIAIEVTNIGDSIVHYGDSGVTVGSGALLNPKASKFWDNVCDNFSMSFIAPDTSTLVIHEYEGN